eukprot:COSAG06_NODE_9722_length_1833_cov_67.074971_1_plen_139_part_10
MNSRPVRSTNRSIIRSRDSLECWPPGLRKPRGHSRYYNLRVFRLPIKSAAGQTRLRARRWRRRGGARRGPVGDEELGALLVPGERVREVELPLALPEAAPLLHDLPARVVVDDPGVAVAVRDEEAAVGLDRHVGRLAVV